MTLTNTDCKILAKALAERLSGVIPKLVSEDQVGYIRGRNIATVIRTIDDVITYLNRTKQAGGSLAVDFRKAFDSISKDFYCMFSEHLGSVQTFKNGSQF